MNKTNHNLSEEKVYEPEILLPEDPRNPFDHFQNTQQNGYGRVYTYQFRGIPALVISVAAAIIGIVLITLGTLIAFTLLGLFLIGGTVRYLLRGR